MNNSNRVVAWKLAYWTLLVSWVLGAAMNMWHMHGGFLTNYLADLTFPPWYYIVIRGLSTTGKKPPFLLRWFGVSAVRAAISILIAGVAYEMGQRYRMIPGTSDLWDVAAYAVGPVICLAFEKRHRANIRSIDSSLGDFESSERRSPPL
jgi:hypothetical protein